MAPAMDDSPDSDYFNDLSRQPSKPTEGAEERRESQEDNNGQPSKAKRMACVLCRKRKLKCDGAKPSCGTCARLSHDCSYDEVRRKSGPKRGYVKALEARLAQVETMLKTQDEPSNGGKESQNGAGSARTGSGSGRPAQRNDVAPSLAKSAPANTYSDFTPFPVGTAIDDPQLYAPEQARFPDVPNGNGSGDGVAPIDEPFPWEMIGLGLDEPLPQQDVIDELTNIYFDKVHAAVPMIHRPRYMAAMHLAPHMRPPICLRYAMWANAASVSEKYEALQEHFYLRARKYIQQDEMRGHGEPMVTIAHAQTWALLTTYEFKMMFFPRAWMSSGRCTRLTLMMGLHRMDGAGLDVKQCLPPPKDWTEREERRRTFWSSFCVDRYASIGTGWPMSIEERDILTNLPVDEDAYEFSRPQKTMSLPEALDPSGPPGLSSYGGVVLMACLFGRNLTHLHRPSPDDRDDDLNGEFWKRHRMMDNILLNTSLALPDGLRLPHGLNDPNIVFLNMNIHTSAICLHQAAIFKADKNRMPARISAESKVRCITAAAEIASIMRMISHLDLSGVNPFISFCLYVAARVFVQYLKSRPKDTQVRTSLTFLLSAMHAIKRKNPLTESFLVQLDVDLESAGLEDTKSLRAQINKRPQQATKTSACANMGIPPSGSQEAGQQGIPTFGDNGLGAYNHPRPIPNGTNSANTYNVNNIDMTQNGFMDMLPNVNQFDLPRREQRTPGSSHNSMHDSNNSNLNRDMDTSPDGSGGDQQTPNSQQNQSSHTSNTAYSPLNMQDFPNSNNGQRPNNNTISAEQNFFNIDPNDPSAFLSTNFDMHSFPPNPFDTQQPGFVLPQQKWDGENLGFGGASTGMTPGADMMAMSDAEWNQVMEGLGDWEPQRTVGHEGNMFETMAAAAGKREG